MKLLNSLLLPFVASGRIVISGTWQTVQTQIRHRRMKRLIRVSAVCE